MSVLPAPLDAHHGTRRPDSLREEFETTMRAATNLDDPGPAGYPD